MNAVRVGRVVRALRRRRGWRQVELAARARVSASTVSRIEAGAFRLMPLDTLERVAEALGLILDLVPRWQGEGLDRLLDEGHAARVDELVRRLTAAGWQVGVEVSFAIGGERGSIDILAFHPVADVLLVVEVKSVVPDAQATIHGLDRKARLAPRVALARGWRASRVVRLLVVHDDRTSRRRVERLGATFEVAFPVRGRAATRWVSDPIRAARERGPGPVAALLFLSPVHGGHGDPARGGRYRMGRA